MESPPAGWYPDPQVPDQLRYWDGSQWTDQLAPKVAALATSGRDRMVVGFLLMFFGVFSLVRALATSGGSDAFEAGELSVPVLLLIAGPIVVLNGWRRRRAARK